MVYCSNGYRDGLLVFIVPSMHTLHTTPAFVLKAYPHGESNRVYRLFTREHGLLYVHGQGVRSLANRNRYALRTHGFVRATLVRGREVWRLTSAQAVCGESATEWRRVLALVGDLLAEEDAAPRVFDLLHESRRVFMETGDSGDRCVLEALTVLRALALLGYVGDSSVQGALDHAAPLTDNSRYLPCRDALVREVNDALRACAR